MTFGYLMQLLTDGQRRDKRPFVGLVGGWADEVLVEADRLQEREGMAPEKAIVQALANLGWAFLRIRKRNQLHFGGQHERMVHRVGRSVLGRQGEFELSAEAACCSSLSPLAAIAPPWDLDVVQEFNPGKVKLCTRCFPPADLVEKRSAAALRSVETRRQNALRHEIEGARAKLRKDERLVRVSALDLPMIDGDPVAMDEHRRIVRCEHGSPARIGCAVRIVAHQYVVVQLADPFALWRLLLHQKRRLKWNTLTELSRPISSTRDRACSPTTTTRNVA